MSTEEDIEALRPDHVFDGGDMDCGSGLILLLREAMVNVPPGRGVLEMRSREPTVADELPAWCRLVGHSYLGALGGGEGGASVRHFIRRGSDAEAQTKALQEDKEKARGYSWRVRLRATGPLRSTAYFRNFTVEVGQPASFDEKDEHPSALEYLLAGLGGELCNGFAARCRAAGLEVEDIEVTVKGGLHNVLAHLGLEEGDPSLEAVDVTGYASTFDDEEAVRAIWEETLRRSPVFATLKKAATVRPRLVLM